MYEPFSCHYDRDFLVLTKQTPIPLYSVTIKIDQKLFARCRNLSQLVINRRDYDAGAHHLSIETKLYHGHKLTPYRQQFLFYGLDSLESHRTTNRTFQAGDLLIACDNTFGIPHGYMGHVAMAIDDKSLIEAVAFFPCIRISAIEPFLKEHPNHAHYRPKDARLGRAATDWAIYYHDLYKQNIRKGILRPIFSFVANAPLEDPWGAVYCSKLAWLSYYYGAHVHFENDFGLFAPEDLERCLSQDERFKLIYKHPKYEFKIDL